MLNNFFRINLPYGIAKDSNGKWMAFNREYLPLGFNNIDLKGSPGADYFQFPIYTAYKTITEKKLLKLVDEPQQVHRSENGDIIRIFLYTDDTNPVNKKTDSKRLWDKYFEKLRILSRIEKK